MAAEVKPFPIRVEAQLGRSYMDSYSANAGFLEATFREHPIGQTAFTWSPDVSMGWINGRNLARYNHYAVSTEDKIWIGAAGIRLRYGGDASYMHHFFFSIQPSLHTGRTQALSSSYEFVSTLGWQGSHVSLQIRHISNGSLHAPNRGETMVLVGFGLNH
ncbi:hypothetical protein GCM10027065_23570 [Rhodanobacter koreensis]